MYYMPLENIEPRLLVASHHQEDGQRRHHSVAEIVDWEGETHEADSDEKKELSEDIEIVIHFQSLQNDDDASGGEPSFAL